MKFVSIVSLTLGVLFYFLGSPLSVAQKSEKKKLIQLSGVTTMSAEGHYLPFVNVKNLSQNSVTTSSGSGVYSIIGYPGDSVRFSFVGFTPAYYVIPSSPGRQFLTHNEFMHMDTFYLPEAIVKPLPTKETFDYKFVYEDIDDDIVRIAQENTEYNQLQFLSAVLLKDGSENTRAYMQKEYSERWKNYKQFGNSDVLSPAAWMEFIDTYLNKEK